jgi:hypothetical protein
VKDPHGITLTKLTRPEDAKIAEVGCFPNRRSAFLRFLMASLHSSLNHGFPGCFGFVVFNDGTDTYLHPGNESYSAIDLTVTDPSLLLDFSWKVHDDLCRSDHLLSDEFGGM